MSSRKLAVYTIGGALSYAIKLAVTVLLAEWAGMGQVWAYVVAVLVNVVFTYAYNHFLTFRAEGEVQRRFALYVLALGVSYALDVGLMALLTAAGVDYRLSLTASTGALFVVKYFVFDRFVFS